jgi:hypothetical protein
LKPDHWPQQEVPAQEDRKTRIQHIFQWMATRPEQTIAVVCHFNVIMVALAGYDIRPKNAVPIPCRLHPDGRLVPIE